jgi:hypothetical protein
VLLMGSSEPVTAAAHVRVHCLPPARLCSTSRGWLKKQSLRLEPNAPLKIFAGCRRTISWMLSRKSRARHTYGWFHVQQQQRLQVSLAAFVSGSVVLFA